MRFSWAGSRASECHPAYGFDSYHETSALREPFFGDGLVLQGSFGNTFAARVMIKTSAPKRFRCAVGVLIGWKNDALCIR
jgi:hypothetical protein